MDTDDPMSACIPVDLEPLELGDGTGLPPGLEKFDRTPQRTPNWWKRRSGRISGSKLSQFMFIASEEEFVQYAKEVFGLVPRPKLDEEAMVRVRWGVDHEPDACATLLHHIPGLKVWEIGFEYHPVHAFMGSSPDGLAYWPEKFPDNPWGAVEIKCCTKHNAKGLSIPHVGVPFYYIPQLHAEMKCMPSPTPATWTVFVSWSATKSKIYIVHFSPTLWDILWEVIVDFVVGDRPYEVWSEKRDRLTAACKEAARNATLVAVVQSCSLIKQ